MSSMSCAQTSAPSVMKSPLIPAPPVICPEDMYRVVVSEPPRLLWFVSPGIGKRLGVDDVGPYATLRPIQYAVRHWRSFRKSREHRGRGWGRSRVIFPVRGPFSSPTPPIGTGTSLTFQARPA